MMVVVVVMECRHLLFSITLTLFPLPFLPFLPFPLLSSPHFPLPPPSSSQPFPNLRSFPFLILIFPHSLFPFFSLFFPSPSTCFTAHPSAELPIPCSRLGWAWNKWMAMWSVFIDRKVWKRLHWLWNSVIKAGHDCKEFTWWMNKGRKSIKESIWKEEGILWRVNECKLNGG